jgi:aspartyl/glutamyl-tRNA(Asn/Gln) amidotransferase subunit C (EC 6.3.5.-)
MALTLEDVAHVARLARLRLSPAELEKMRDQLSNILDHFQMLQQIDVSTVPPTAQSPIWSMFCAR